MHCCGSPFHQITVQTGAGALTLLRCTHCTQQRWAREGTLLEREQAFTQLARAYRGVPEHAQLVRQRSAATTRARRVARDNQRPAAPAAEVRPDAAHLLTMLDGWQVFGASA